MYFDDKLMEYLYVTGQLDNCSTFSEKIEYSYLMYDSHDDEEEDSFQCTDTLYEDKISKKDELNIKRRIYRKNEQ